MAMSDDDTKALFDRTPEELVDYFGNDPSIWAYNGVGMLRSAYRAYEISEEKFKSNFQKAKNGGESTRAFLIELSIDRSCQVYKLLAANAMENLAKGLIIAKGELSIEDHKLPQCFLSHDIIRLLSSVAFKYDDGERMALEDSTRAIIWQARYPMPKNPKPFSQNRSLSLGQRYSHPETFRNIAIRMLRDYPTESLQATQFSPGVSDLVNILKTECPKPENLSDEPVTL